MYAEPQFFPKLQRQALDYQKQMSDIEKPLQTKCNEIQTKTLFCGKLAIIQNRGSSYQQIVIGIADLKQLYYEHRNSFATVGELVDNLKQIVMDENKTNFLPGIMVLPEGSEIQVNKGQLEKLEESQEMQTIDELEVEREKMMKKKRSPRARRHQSVMDNRLLIPSLSSSSELGLPQIKKRHGFSHPIQEIILDKPEKMMTDEQFRNTTIITDQDSLLTQMVKKNKIVQRIKKEVLEIEFNMNKEYKKSIIKVWASVSNDDPLNWKAKIRGPSDTPYANGVFLLNILFSLNYPSVAPEIKFQTKIYHPNFGGLNKVVELPMLSKKWKSNTTLIQILKEILKVVAAPDLLNHQNFKLCLSYKQDKNLFNQMAQEMTKKYAQELRHMNTYS